MRQERSLDSRRKLTFDRRASNSEFRAFLSQRFTMIVDMGGIPYAGLWIVVQAPPG